MSTRDEDEQVIFAAINGGIFEINPARLQNAESLIRSGTDAEVRAIAAAHRLDPSGFNGTFLQSLYTENTLDTAATLATVYSPDIDPGRSRHFRVNVMRNAYVYYVAADESAYPHLRHHKDLSDHPIWSIANESPMLQSRAQRFVAMTCALNGLTPRVSLEVQEMLRAIMLDDNRTDHTEIIEFLRRNKGEHLTFAQIDFFLNGGSAAITSGAL